MAPVYEMPLADMPPKVKIPQTGCFAFLLTLNYIYFQNITIYEKYFTLLLYKYVHFCNINIKDDIPEDYDYSHFEYINKVILSVFNFTISSLRFHKEMAGIF